MPDAALVEIQAARAPDIQNVGFDEFQRLTLPLPAGIRKHVGLRAAQAGVILADASYQFFVIDYRNASRGLSA